MGASGQSVTFKALADKTPTPPETLFDETWEELQNIWYKYLGRPANKEALEYGDDNMYDQRRSSLCFPNQLTFWFSDTAASTLPHALLHWTVWTFPLEFDRLNRVANKNGYEFERDVSLSTLVRKGIRTGPLYYYNNHICYVPRRRLGTPIPTEIWADGEPTCLVADLPEKDRDNVSRISLTGRCHCEICSQARKVLKPKKPRGAKKDHPFDDKTLDPYFFKGVELLTENIEIQGLYQSAREKVVGLTDADWEKDSLGPAEFQVLRDALEQQGAPMSIISLTGMMHYKD